MHFFMISTPFKVGRKYMCAIPIRCELQWDCLGKVCGTVICLRAFRLRIEVSGVSMLNKIAEPALKHRPIPHVARGDGDPGVPSHPRVLPEFYRSALEQARRSEVIRQFHLERRALNNSI
jgi:hypothetical protein